MRLKYETGIATLIQFIGLSFLGFLDGVDSVVTTCHRDGSNCISNTLVSMILFILIASWFGFVWFIGLTAQDRRGKRIAQFLIIIEAVSFMGSIAVLKFHSNIIEIISSLGNLVLSAWIIVLAYRLMKSGGGRIVVKQRARKRRPTTTDL